jgi:hypothetical protein
MGRYRRRMSADYQTENYNPDERYDLAYKRVKRIKGFYIHLLVYLIVNTFIIAANSNNNFIGNENFWSFETFSTALFWGIGLTAHGLSVFSRNIFFGKNWEERKIQELMEKEKKEKWE